MDWKSLVGKRMLAAVALLPLIVCCDGYRHPVIPYAHVDFCIFPDDAMYYRLNTFGGYEYFTGGVNGIVVYRLDQWTFLAYDRACPYDWQEQDSWLCVDESGLFLVDSLCGSVFNILDGERISGPASFPALRYNTRFDGVRLRVFSR